MKIKVILTGGTIGSELSGGVLSPVASPAAKLEAAYRKSGGRADFEFSSPFTVLSENLCAEYLNMLVENILSAYKGGFDKIIVCHGTDTLQYSAAAVMYALAGLPCTAVFVSAAKPLDDENTNGFENFCAAAAFLETRTVHGVFAAYANSGENAKIMPASRLALFAENSDSLRCVNDDFTAVYSGGKITDNPAWENTVSRETGLNMSFCEYSGIEVFSAVPGRRYGRCASDTRAVILRPYHSGTLNTENSDFADFCRDAAERDIPVFVVDIRNGAQYESSLKFKELGITELFSTAFASAYIKAWLAHDKRGNELRKFMQTSFAGETEAE